MPLQFTTKKEGTDWGQVLIGTYLFEICIDTHISNDRYKDKGVKILGFPCNQFMEQEPGDSVETKKICELNYGVEFQLFEKIDVNGKFAHPIFKYLTQNAPFDGTSQNS